MNFKLSGFADESGVTAEEQIQGLKANKMNYIEIRNINGKNILELSDDELKTLKNNFDKENIKVSAIGSPIGKSPITEDFNITLKKFDRAMAAAEILDAVYIRAFSFYPEKETDPMQWADEVISRLTELAKIAAQKGKVYAMENDSKLFADITERCAYVLDRIPDIRLVFDPGNFIMSNSSPLEAWKLFKNRIAYFHIKDAQKDPRRFVPAGEGEGSIAEILKDAYSMGFDSFLSLEPHLKYIENLNDAERFTKAVNALKKILNESFNAGMS